MNKNPKIRFTGYTDDWEQRKLTDYLEVSSEKNKNDTYEKGDVLSVSGEYGIVNQIEFQGRSFAGASVANYGIVEVGDVVYTKSPLKSNPYGIIKTNKGKSGIVSTLYAVYKPKEITDSKFVQIYFELDSRMNSYMHPLVNKGAKNDMKVSDENALKGPVIFPNLEEQKKISSYFEKLDHLITLHQRKCEELKKLKKYMLQKMFPQNDNKFPEIRFSGFTNAWEQRKLEDLSYSFEYGLNAAAKEFDGENKYIRITDIDDDTREFLQKDVTSPDIDLSRADNYKLLEGDILLARTGASVGKSYIYRVSDGLVYYAGFLIRARIKKEYNSEFVFQNTLTKNFEKFITVTSMRSGQPGINAQEYSQYKIMVPSRSEQDKISAYLRSLDNLITLHQRKCEELKKLKKYMLQNMFV